MDIKVYATGKLSANARHKLRVSKARRGVQGYVAALPSYNYDRCTGGARACRHWVAIVIHTRTATDAYLIGTRAELIQCQRKKNEKQHNITKHKIINLVTID